MTAGTPLPARREHRSSCGSSLTGARGRGLACAALALACLAWPARAEAQGRAFVNFGFGPTVWLTFPSTQIHVSLQAGLAVARHLYVMFLPSGSFGDGFTTVTLPLGLEYDIPIRGVRNLYVYPRIAMGAGVFFDRGPGSRAAFVVQPAFGIKYAVAGVWNIGIEPLDFPIYIADTPGYPTSAYRFSGVTGFNF